MTIENFEGRFTPPTLPDPDPIPRPEPELNPHTQGGYSHFDPVVYVPSSTGWGWERKSAVNFRTADEAQAWIDANS